MRHSLLIGGGTNTGRTTALIHIAVMCPTRRVAIFDADGQVADTLEENGLTLPNLEVVPATPDWGALDTHYKRIKATYVAGDFVCFDMLGRFWDFSQNYFSKSVYGASPAQHIITLREQAKKADFGGFDGLTDWTVIKRLHNEDLLDDATQWSSFHVVATTNLEPYSIKERVPTTGTEGLIAKEFNSKLEGEKHNRYRFRNIAIVYRRLTDGQLCFKLVKVKDAMPLPLPEHEFGGRFFFEAYCQVRGIPL